jgi:hypothetical protein
MIGNIRTATGVTTTVKDKKLFQSEVEDKRSGRVSRLERKNASSAVRGMDSSARDAESG